MSPSTSAKAVWQFIGSLGGGTIALGVVLAVNHAGVHRLPVSPAAAALVAFGATVLGGILGRVAA